MKTIDESLPSHKGRKLIKRHEHKRERQMSARLLFMNEEDEELFITKQKPYLQNGITL